jgi:hypothetical protein
MATKLIDETTLDNSETLERLISQVVAKNVPEFTDLVRPYWIVPPDLLVHPCTWFGHDTFPLRVKETTTARGFATFEPLLSYYKNALSKNCYILRTAVAALLYRYFSPF